jgi:hypothetical protein
MSFDNPWQWSETAASNTAIASIDITGATGKVKDGDNAIRALMSQIITMEGKGTAVASAGTLTLGSERYYHVTGTTTITDIDFTDAVDGRWAWLVFDDALTLTYNATTLLLPGGANITTVANDRALFVQDSSDNIICLAYIRQSGNPITYSVGAWTPSIIGTTSAGAGTYSLQTGFYIKMGRLVFCSAVLNWSAHTGTGNMKIDGLPFVTVVANSHLAPVTLWYDGLTFPGAVVGHIDLGATTVTLQTAATGASNTALAIDTAAALRMTAVFAASS